MKQDRISARRGWRLLRARPRLLFALAAGLVCWASVPVAWVHHEATRTLIGWNVGALTYLVLALVMMLRASHEQIRRRALQQDDGRWLVLGLSVLASTAVLVAVASQLSSVKDMASAQRTGHVALAAATVVLAWLFIQTAFALHYAHEFYAARVRNKRQADTGMNAPDGLAFPGTTDPLYVDFLYFACVIGTSAQTADVSFVGTDMRTLGMMHCVLAFFFNTTVLALTINIAASLF